MSRYYQRPTPSWIAINVRLKAAKLLYNSNSNGAIALTCSGHLHLGHVLLEKLVEDLHEVEAVVGLGINGYPLASAVSCLSIMSHFHPIDAIYLNDSCVVGKLDHKKAGLVLIKDSAHSGVNIVDSVKILRSFKYRILGVLVLVDYEEGAREELAKIKVPFYSVFTPTQIKTEVEEWENSKT